MKYPSALRAALAKLPPTSYLKATLMASTVDVLGKVVKDKVTVRIPGTKH